MCAYQPARRTQQDTAFIRRLPAGDRRDQASPRLAARIALATRVRARQSEIEEAILARISDDRFDRKGSDNIDYRDGLRDAAKAAVEWGLAGMERGGGFLDPIPAPVVEQARRAARVGVSLETVLRRYLAAHAVVQAFVIEEAERGPRPASRRTLQELLGLSSRLIDRLLTAVSRVYRREIERDGTDVGVKRDTKGRKEKKGQKDPVAPLVSASVDPPSSGTSIANRERLVSAIVETVAEEGWDRATVEAVITRAKASRRMLYQVFPGGLREGLVAALDDASERVSALALERLPEAERCWPDGVRRALAALLVFFEAEPQLARVCLVETLAGDRGAVEARARALGRFHKSVASRIEREQGTIPHPLAESAIASVTGVLYNRLLEPAPSQLLDLLGDLMATILRISGASTDSVRKEVERSQRLVEEIRDRDGSWAAHALCVSQGQGLDPSPASRETKRAQQCLLYLAEHPGASNRAVGTAINVTHKSQISTLLAHLRERGLILLHTDGPGTPNRWRLASAGAKLVHELASGD